jgi:epoxyqueuosine reductase
MQAGIGWQGKHTNLVSKEYGSWLFLSSIFLDIEFNSNPESKNHCGSCTQCIDICPTNAIVEPYKIDAKKCISYLTIEHKSHIPKEYRNQIGNRIYGCDDCLAVCPWNKYAKKTSDLDRFIRNVLIAVGNSKNKNYLSEITLLLSDSSDLVRSMAVWALKEILNKKDFELQKKIYYKKESDPEVKNEWIDSDNQIQITH